jgi:hypothetical protein
MRMAERIGITNERNFKDIVKSASKKGQNPIDFPPDTEIGKFLREKDVGKRIKVYKGNVFIFNKTSINLITVYPLPEELKEEYKLYERKNNDKHGKL